MENAKKRRKIQHSTPAANEINKNAKPIRKNEGEEYGWEDYVTHSISKMRKKKK